MILKAITLHQFWASLMAWNLKRNETRNWRTSHRGWLAIHAAGVIPAYVFRCYEQAPLIQSALRPFGIQTAADLRELPVGAILCVVNMVDCVSTSPAPGFAFVEQYQLPAVGTIEHAAGNYSSDRWVWVTRDLRGFKPIPCKAPMRRVWKVPTEVAARCWPPAVYLTDKWCCHANRFGLRYLYVSSQGDVIWRRTVQVVMRGQLFFRRNSGS